MADDRNLMGTFGREKLAQPCGERRVTHGTVGRGLWQVVSKIRDTVRSHTSSSKETAAAERRMAEGAKSEATDAEGTTPLAKDCQHQLTTWQKHRELDPPP
jgi:hypothetical protein